MMRISALLSMATMVAAAPSYCPEDDAVYKDGDATAGELIVCGSSTSTNCVAESGDKDAFCSLVDATKGPFAGQKVAACCTTDDGPAYDVAQKDTCKKCLEDNVPGAVAANTWDGENCFNTEGVTYFPTIPTPDLQYIYGLVTNGDDCPTDAFKLGFTGTCWRRCGTRGWGVNPNTAYYGGTGYGGYGGYGYGGYGMGMGYGGYGMGMGYGGYGGYGMGMYGMYGGYSGAYGAGYGYGMVPSAFGTPCPDPKMLEMFPDAPAVPMPFYGAGGWGMGGGYGGYPSYGYGGYPQPYGYGGYSPYGRQAAMGAQFVGSVYGTPSYGMTGGAAYVGSVYGRPTTTAYAGSVYGGSVYGGSSVYGSPTNSADPRSRCTPITQCSCDKHCGERGDCCHDITNSGCEMHTEE